MTHTDPVQLCCLLWAMPGQEAGLADYEDAVLGLIAEPGGRVVQRARNAGANDQPHEVQLFQFRSQRDVDAYLADPRRTARADERDQVVARTELFPVSF